MLKISQQQKNLQRLSPQQIRLMQLLQLPGINLDERIKEELEENPALEYDGDTEEDSLQSTEDFTDSAEGNSPAEEIYEQQDVEDFLPQDEDFREGLDSNPSNNQTGDYVEAGEYSPGDTTMQELLLQQVALLDLDEIEEQIAEQIIGTLDDDGYLRRNTISIVDDLSFGRSVFVELGRVEEVLEQVRQLEPAGIAARDLQDCLLLQLNRIAPRNEFVTKAISIISKYFVEFSNKQYDRIQRNLSISDDELKEIISTILHLNPRPGAALAVVNKAHSYIVPDFLVYNNNGHLELSLTSNNQPKLRISEGYLDMLDTYEAPKMKADKRMKEAASFLRQKMDTAKWFIDAVQQRYNTLLTTMRTILDLQKQFFLTGDWAMLRPMVLRTVAEKTGYDISTISRVSNSKYVQTEFGVFKLKSLFSEGLQTEDGEEISVHEVKASLVKFVEDEDKKKPLADDALMDKLKEQGFPVARRTIAKYREQLGIPVARLRREL